MAGSLTNYSRNKLIDHILGTTSYTSPTDVYLGIFTVSPSNNSSGTEVVGYTRPIVTFTASSTGSASNDVDITITNMPTCTVTAVGIFDAQTSGNLLAWAVLSPSQSFNATDSLFIPIGDLDLNLN